MTYPSFIPRNRVISAGSFLTVLLAFFSISVAEAQAQEVYREPGTTTADLLLDARARVGDSQHAANELHGGYLSLHSDSLLGPDRFVNLEAIYQYHTFRFQRASVATELRGQRTRRGAVTATEDGDSAAAPMSMAPPLRLEAGVVRVPFGIYDYEETYASGLIQYPLPRLDYAYDSVDWGVSGLKATGYAGPVQVESAFFGGSGQGTWGNFNHVDGVAVRAQTYLPPAFVVGTSVWSGHQSAYPDVANTPSRVLLGGVDMRYTRSHLLLRGEALVGTLAGDRTRGGYLDAYYRLPGVEAVTLVGRIESLRPADAQPTSRQLTLGARWVMTPEWTLSGNWSRNNIARAYAFTWTEPTQRSGAVLFQLLHRIPLH